MATTYVPGTTAARKRSLGIGSALSRFLNAIVAGRQAQVQSRVDAYLATKSDKLLREYGYSAAEIADLRARAARNPGVSSLII